MKLQPHDSALGLWRNPGWKPDTPGAFAVVIGVSDYPYLRGDESSLQLTSLKVSALTAYRFFEWLGTEYAIDGCDIAMCFLLVAPTAEELRAAPQMTRCALRPDWQSCQQAIRWWHHHMHTLAPAAASRSRGLFFFSGHGIEKNLNLQLLLPADYLEPPSPNLNSAISTSNLANGLATLKVPLQLFFIDGCRNAPKQLRDKTIVGTPILNETANSNALVATEDVINPDYVAPMLLATSTGQAAFQPKSVTKGVSLFGEALLNGLAGQPDIALSRRASRSQVKIYPLQDFTEAQVNRQLQAQRVRLGGQTRNEVVTELPLALSPDPATGHAVPPAPGPAPAAWRAPLDRPAAPVLTDARSPSSLMESAPLGVPRSIWSQDEARTHETFGSERASEIWMQRLRLLAISTHTVLDDPDAITVHRVLRDQVPSRWEVHLSIEDDDPIGHWLELRDDGQDPWCVLLLRLDETRPTYLVQFELALRQPGLGRPIVAMEAAVAAGEGVTTRLMAHLWHAQQEGGPSGALRAIRALRDRRGELEAAPLAATFAGLLALRYGDLDSAAVLMQHVNDSVMQRDRPSTDERPLMRVAGDWLALTGGWLARQDASSEARARGCGVFARTILAGGAPHTNEGFFAAQDALRRLLGGTGSMAEDDRRDVSAALARMDAAMPSLAGNGLFLTCANTTADEAMQLFFAAHAAALDLQTAATKGPSWKAIEVLLDAQQLED